MLGSGVPLPKILNIDFSNADIDILEVRGDKAVCFPLLRELGGRGRERGTVGKQGPLPSTDGAEEQETTLEEALNEAFHIQSHLVLTTGVTAPSYGRDSKAQSSKGFAQSRGAVFVGKTLLSTYCVPDNIQGAADTAVNKICSGPFQSSPSLGRWAFGQIFLKELLIIIMAGALKFKCRGSCFHYKNHYENIC